MDCSPLGDLMVLNFNILPTAVPVYFIPSDRRSSLLMTPVDVQEADTFILPKKIEICPSSGGSKRSASYSIINQLSISSGFNAEFIALSVKFHLLNESEETWQTTLTVDKVLRGLLAQEDYDLLHSNFDLPEISYDG